MKLVEPRKVATDHLGHVLVLDKQGLWRLGSTGPPSKLLDGELCDFAIDLSGIVYAVGFEYSMRKVDLDGVVTGLFPRACRNGSPEDCCIVDRVAPYPDGTVVARCRSHRNHFISVTSAGNIGVRPKDQHFPECKTFPISGASGMDTDLDGTVFIADSNASCIRKITLEAAEVLAGALTSTPHRDGLGQGASFNKPRGPAVDGDGNVLAADTSNQCIRLVSRLGMTSTLCGRPGKRGAAMARAWDALFAEPSAVAVDTHGHVLVADTGNGCIRTQGARPPPTARAAARARAAAHRRGGRRGSPAVRPLCGRHVCGGRGRGAGAPLHPRGPQPVLRDPLGLAFARGHRPGHSGHGQYRRGLPCAAVLSVDGAHGRGGGDADGPHVPGIPLSGRAPVPRVRASVPRGPDAEKCGGVVRCGGSRLPAGGEEVHSPVRCRYIANNLSRIVVAAPETMEELKAHPELLYEVTMAHSMKYG